MTAVLPFSSVVLHYFNIRGRGEPIRLILIDNGIPYTEDIVDDDNEEQFDQNKTDLSKYPFCQLPTITIDGVLLAQQDAILRYISGVIDHAGTGDLLQNAKVDQLACGLEDLNRAYWRHTYNSTPVELLTTFASKHLPSLLKPFEHMLSNSSSKNGWYVYDNYPCFAEYTLFYLLTAFTTLRPTLLESEFPLLKKWFTQFGNRAPIKAYLSGDTTGGKLWENFNANGQGNEALC